MLDFQIVYTETIMKTITFISTLAFCASLTATAQGVHLNAGESLLISFNSVSGCSFTQLAPPSYAGVAFGIDLLAPGDSLRLEMFENSLNDSPFATQLYSPAAPVSFVEIYGPMAWLDYQGLIRISMLSGSVDVNFAHFIVGPNVNTFCDTIIHPVPEPSVCALMALGGGLAAIVRICRRRRSGNGFIASQKH